MPQQTSRKCKWWFMEGRLAAVLFQLMTSTFSICAALSSKHSGWLCQSLALHLADAMVTPLSSLSPT